MNIYIYSLTNAVHLCLNVTILWLTCFHHVSSLKSSKDNNNNSDFLLRSNPSLSDACGSPTLLYPVRYVKLHFEVCDLFPLHVNVAPWMVYKVLWCSNLFVTGVITHIVIYIQVRANPPIRFAEWSGVKNLYCTANVTTCVLCILCHAKFAWR